MPVSGGDILFLPARLYSARVPVAGGSFVRIKIKDTLMKARDPRDFSKRGDALPIPNLINVQLTSYQKFLQKDSEVAKRKPEGLEGLLREVFPIESYDGNLRLEYISYDLSEPRYTTDECRALRLTYGMPFRIQVRFVRNIRNT